MSGLLDFLFNDPSGSVGGRGLMGLLGLNAGNPGAATSTPLTPPASSFFTPRTGLLGSSNFANGMRGALAGLGGAGMGYGGIGELGTGASAAVDASRQRQAFQMENVLGGQQYQAGQQGLIGGNINNVFALERVNAIRKHFDPSAPDLTINDLMQNPSLAASPTGGITPPPQGSAQPAQPVGMQPIYGGGDNVDPQVAQAYGPSLTADQQPPAETTPQGDGQSQASADPILNAMNKNLDLAWASGDLGKVTELQQKILEYQGAPGHSAATAGATKSATDTIEFNSPQYHNTQAQTIATAFLAAPGVKDYRNAQPYIAPLIAAARGDTGIGEIDLINSALHIWNPDAGTIKPGTALSMEDLKGIPAAIRKHVVAAVAGGGVLPDVEKNALIQAAINHYGSIAKNYDTTRQNFALRAKSAVPGGLQEPEYNDQASQGGAPQVGMYSKGHIYMGGDPAQPGSWMAVQ